MMGLFRATFYYAGFSLVGSAFGSVMRTASNLAAELPLGDQPNEVGAEIHPTMKIT